LTKGRLKILYIEQKKELYGNKEKEGKREIEREKKKKRKIS